MDFLALSPSVCFRPRSLRILRRGETRDAGPDRTHRRDLTEIQGNVRRPETRPDLDGNPSAGYQVPAPAFKTLNRKP